MDNFGDKLRCEHCKKVFINTNPITVGNERRIQRCPHCYFFLIGGRRGFGYRNISEEERKKNKRNPMKRGKDFPSLPSWVG